MAEVENREMAHVVMREVTISVWGATSARFVRYPTFVMNREPVSSLLKWASAEGAC